MIIQRFIFTDAEDPIISDTPSTQNVNTDAHSPTATVSWTPPTASDNSGETVTLTSDYESGDTFPIGTTTVTYAATDTSGNTATSTFNVVVTGMTTKWVIEKVRTTVSQKCYNHEFVFVLFCFVFLNETCNYNTRLRN